eukprot:scaffold244543_cov14-Tisochrysis_lutea.AAC.1
MGQYLSRCQNLISILLSKQSWLTFARDAPGSVLTKRSPKKFWCMWSREGSLLVKSLPGPAGALRAQPFDA